MGCVRYIGRAPGPPLDRFIDDIYCMSRVPHHQRLNVPPMPSAHLFINLAGPVTLHDCDPASPPAVFTDGSFTPSSSAAPGGSREGTETLPPGRGSAIHKDKRHTGVALTRVAVAAGAGQALRCAVSATMRSRMDFA